MVFFVYDAHDGWLWWRMGWESERSFIHVRMSLYIEDIRSIHQVRVDFLHAPKSTRVMSRTTNASLLLSSHWCWVFTRKPILIYVPSIIALWSNGSNRCDYNGAYRLVAFRLASDHKMHVAEMHPTIASHATQTQQTHHFYEMRYKMMRLYCVWFRNQNLWSEAIAAVIVNDEHAITWHGTD